MVKELELIAQEVESLISAKLVVWNDDFNTFDWVIRSFVNVLQHNPIQAEQCAFIIHFKGKCTVKEGSEETLQPMKQALLDRGLSATIEQA